MNPFAILLLTAAAAGPAVPGPTFAAGDEIVYAGEITEESDRVGGRFRRKHAVEVRLFVLESRPGGADVAVMTLLRPLEDPHVRDAAKQVAGTAASRPAAPPAVRLELIRVDPKGGVRRLVPPPALPLSLTGRTPTEPAPDPPLDAPAAVELGMFAPLPDPVTPAGSSWQVAGTAWRVGPTAVRNGAQVVELVGVRESADWATRTGVSRAWRRTDRVWVSPADGLARVFERTVEVTDGVPVAERRTVRAETAPPTAHRGDAYDAARREIEAAYRFAADAEAAGRTGRFDPVKRAIQRYVRDHDPTAYRGAVEAVYRRCEAGRK